MGAPRSAELNLSCPRMMNGPFPHYLLLPDVSNLKPSDWNLRYLAKLSDAINQIDYRKTLPFLRLMDFFKDGLVDGCSLTILEKSTFCRPSICKVPPSIVDYLVQCVASDYDILNDSLVIFDDESSVCYLTLPLGKFDGLNGDYLLLLWKHNSIFTSDDVATVKLALQLFRGRFHEIGLDDAASHLAERVWDSDEALRAVLNAIPDLVIVCAQNGKVLGFNEAAQRSFRCLIPVRDAANGTTWMRELAHPDDAPYLLDVWTEATHDQVSRKLRCRLLIERSVYHKVLWRFSPIRDQNENTLWAIVATDLEIGETSDEVRSMAVMKGRFLAEISHEIRTPLACILGTSTLLSHTNLDADQQELLRTISLSSQQLSSLISNVLDLSRIEENKLVLERIPIMIEKSVHEVVELFRTNLVRMKIDTIIEIHPAVPEWIISDELCLRQVLTNLLGNAIKFSPPDSVVVVRVARIVVNDVEYVKFYVEDEGPGISEETGKRLFESFSQADVSTARKYGGSGLGLVISKGSVFRFRIPKEEIKDVPEAYLVAVNSFRTLLAGLKGFRHHFKASQPMKLLLAFRHCKLNRHYYDILQPLEVVAVTCGQQGHTTIPSEPVIIVTDDSNLVKDAMNCDNVIGIAYADYDLRKDLIGSKVHFIRKPIRDVGLLQFLQGFYIKDDEPLPQPLSLQPQGIIPIADTYPLVILIAEDDPMSQKLLVRILDKLGYHNVAQANNGEEAVNAAITTLAPRPQLVLMDMEMPVMDGCYASKRIRLELEHGPHIVAMTANAFTEDRNTCLEAGMCDYASKPVKMEALVELLKHAHDVSQRKIPCRCNQWGRVG